MNKKWDDYGPDEQQKIRAYLNTSAAGEQLTDMATHGGATDMDFLVWLLKVDALCGRNAGVSILDLADFLWRDAFDDEREPAEVLLDALRADGLVA